MSNRYTSTEARSWMQTSSHHRYADYLSTRQPRSPAFRKSKRPGRAFTSVRRRYWPNAKPAHPLLALIRARLIAIFPSQAIAVSSLASTKESRPKTESGLTVSATRQGRRDVSNFRNQLSAPFISRRGSRIISIVRKTGCRVMAVRYIQL